MIERVVCFGCGLKWVGKGRVFCCLSSFCKVGCYWVFREWVRGVGFGVGFEIVFMVYIVVFCNYSS